VSGWSVVVFGGVLGHRWPSSEGVSFLRYISLFHIDLGKFHSQLVVF
jgi:hypothetical protein